MGRHPDESWLVSLSTSPHWPLFFAAKSIRIKGKRRALIVGIDIEKLTGKVINCTTEESCVRVGIRGCTPRNWEKSAGEVLVARVEAEAIVASEMYCLDPLSPHGQILLDVEGKDRETDPSTGAIQKFGCFSEWMKAFDAQYPEDRDKEFLYEKLSVQMASASQSSGVGRNRRAQRS